MRNLHKNTGKHKKEFKLGRWMLFYNRAEDPSVKWYKRLWSTDKENTRSNHLFSIDNIESKEYDNKAFVIYMGPFQVYIGRIKK